MHTHLPAARAVHPHGRTDGAVPLARHPASGAWLAAGSLALAGVLCSVAFVALIHAPLPEELLASLGNEAAAAIGRPANP